MSALPLQRTRERSLDHGTNDYVGKAQQYRERAEEAARLVDKMATDEAKRLMIAMSRDFANMPDLTEDQHRRDAEIVVRTAKQKSRDGR